jgi:hypothetical protein
MASTNKYLIVWQIINLTDIFISPSEDMYEEILRSLHGKY